MRPACFSGFYELSDKSVVFLAVNPRLLQTEIKRIMQQTLIISADIQEYGQSARWIEPCASRVKRKFSDRNAHSAGAEVA